MAAAVDAQALDFVPSTMISTSPSPPPTAATNTPVHGRSPSQSTTEVQRRRQQRHSKKLSINFPILVPVRGVDTPVSMYTTSPTSMSTNTLMQGAFSPPSTYTTHSHAPSSVAASLPLTPPSEEEPLPSSGRVRSKSRGHVRQESTSTEFLTLLASQERRVLELKEELVRAETELTALKKKWAQYEAGKKKSEIKGNPLRMGPVNSSHTRSTSNIEGGAGLGLSGIEEPISDDKLEAERERRREIARERMMGRLNGEISHPIHGTSRKPGQRVFAGSRHTRALSLLTTATNTRSERSDSLDGHSNSETSIDSSVQISTDTLPIVSSTNTIPSIPALSRTNSGLDSLNLNLGKTYKELAASAASASRKNLPPGLSPEQFVKQGKLVVDGVRDGLWNFFEDIRQATVGEEPIPVRRQNSSRPHGHNGNSKVKRSATDAAKKEKENQDTSFWKEFGIETPKSDRSKKAVSDNHHHVKEREKRPSLPGRWPSTQVGDEVPKCCPKHGHGRSQKSTTTKKSKNLHQTDDSATTVHKKEPADHEHHGSKSSTDSGHPPSLVSDGADEEEGEEQEVDEGWDAWDASSLANTDPNGSPQVPRVRPRARSVRVLDREEEWHGLIS